MAEYLFNRCEAKDLPGIELLATQFDMCEIEVPEDLREWHPNTPNIFMVMNYHPNVRLGYHDDNGPLFIQTLAEKNHINCDVIKRIVAKALKITNATAIYPCAIWGSPYDLREFE